MDRHEIDMGREVEHLITAARRYAEAYRSHFDSPVGDDGVLGDGVRDVLRGVNTLLNGPLGREDGGTCSSMLCAIAREHNLADENGEF